MAMTVLDSSDLPGILSDAGVETEIQPPANEEGGEKPPQKAENEANVNSDDPDDIEGEDGLTPRQKREFTAQMQKAIGKKHRMQKEAEEFAAAQYNEKKMAEQRAALLEQELAQLRAKSAPAQEEKAPQKPDRQNFATESEYIDAMIQYGVDQRLREKAEEDARNAAQRSQQQLIETAKGRIQKAMELVPDYADVTGAVDMEVPPAVAGYMQKSEMFAELGYHLAKNPDILVSLAKLQPDEQLVKIGKIESTLTPFGATSPPNDDKSSKETPNGPSVKTPSNDTGIIPSKSRGSAAPVITPLDGGGTAGTRKNYEDMNIREAIEDYSKRNRLNLGARKRH